MTMQPEHDDGDAEQRCVVDLLAAVGIGRPAINSCSLAKAIILPVKEIEPMIRAEHDREHFAAADVIACA